MVLVLVLVYVGWMAWAAFSVWNSVERVDAEPAGERPAAAAGSNFVLVGTDSRENLDQAERNDLVTGSTEGSRADTVMLLHVPDSGSPTLVSLPRDSIVDVPGIGETKINTAYAAGGPTLLVETIEANTGLRMDGYLEVGFGGFVGLVQTVGGVEMCLPEPVQDERTRLDLPAGCQVLEGAEALNYVRMRYGDPRGDLGRVERQREFLAGIVREVATPSTALLPWRLHSVGTSLTESFVLSEDTSMAEAARIALAMRSVSSGDGQSITVPISDPNAQTAAGSSVIWDEQGAAELWEALRTDSPLTIDP